MSFVRFKREQGPYYSHTVHSITDDNGCRFNRHRLFTSRYYIIRPPRVIVFSVLLYKSMRFSFNPNFGEISKDQKFILYDFIRFYITHSHSKTCIYGRVIYIITVRYIMLLYSSDETIRGNRLTTFITLRLT